MRVFWGLILVLVVAAGVVFAVRRGPAPARVNETANAVAPAPTVEQPKVEQPKVEQPKVEQQKAEPARVEVPRAEVPKPEVKPEVSKAEIPKADVPKPEAPKVEAPKPEAVKPVAPTPEVVKPEVPKVVEKPVGVPPAAPGVAPQGAGAAPAAAPSAGAAPSAKAEPDPAAPAKLVAQADGTTLVDDRFTMKGSGTKDDPYVITWELLVSAKETYAPRLGKKVIPDRLKRLDGKWVRIGGFVAFPIMAQAPDEMLVMLNQWDGCCIGVPPTPYDAVEVRLKQAAEGEDRMRVTGTLKGILHVDPYLVKDWLVSLYVMDDGVITAQR